MFIVLIILLVAAFRERDRAQCEEPDPPDRAKALAAGFRAHLSKPLDPESLLRELSRAPGRPAA